MASKIVPTRQELMRMKNKKKTAQRGHKLLKDKRDSLMRSFLEVIREALELRKKLDERYEKIFQQFQLARSLMDEEYLDILSQNPSTKVFIERENKNIMSVIIPVLKVLVEGDFLNYSLLQTNPHLDQSLKGARKLLPDILLLMEKENAARRLAVEIEKTRRRVNALEHVVIPEVQHNINWINAALEEQARETTVSLIKMKERMAQAG